MTAAEAYQPEPMRELGADPAEFLGAMRYLADMTIKEFAREMQVGPATIQRWENGVAPPGIKQARQIVGYFGLLPEEVDTVGFVVERSKPTGGTGNKGAKLRYHGIRDVEDPVWMSEGKCRELPPETFFPSDGVGVGIARRVCADCPVKAPCLEYALYNRIEHGVWGGASERERRRIARQRSGLARAAQ